MGIFEEAQVLHVGYRRIVLRTIDIRGNLFELIMGSVWSGEELTSSHY